MSKVLANTVDSGARWWYALGGISAFTISIGYVVIIALFVSVGAPPSGGEAWLEYGAGKTAPWWAILGLSVVTDLLFVPVAFALYMSLKDVHRDAMLLATVFIGLFVVLDLAVTWSNYAGLITLSGTYSATTTEAQRAAYVAAATYATAVLSSAVEGVYSILVPAVGILVVGVVMLRGVFSGTAAYLGVATGILGIVSVVGPLFVSTLGFAIIVASLLTTAWLVVVGHRLYELGGRSLSTRSTSAART